MFGCSHIQTTQNHQVVRFQPYRAIPTTQSVARSLQGTLGCICFQPRNTGSESPDTRNHGAHGLHLEPEVCVENLRSVCLLCPAEVDEDRVLGTGRGQRKSLPLPTSHRPPAYNSSHLPSTQASQTIRLLLMAEPHMVHVTFPSLHHALSVLS